MIITIEDHFDMYLTKDDVLEMLVCKSFGLMIIKLLFMIVHDYEFKYK